MQLTLRQRSNNMRLHKPTKAVIRKYLKENGYTQESFAKENNIIPSTLKTQITGVVNVQQYFVRLFPRKIREIIYKDLRGNLQEFCRL